MWLQAITISGPLDSQGKYDEALVYSQKALMIRIKVLGEGHPDVASSYNNIGSALNSQGKYDEALGLLAKSFNDSDKSAG